MCARKRNRLNPAIQATAPKTTTTNRIEVVQNDAISFSNGPSDDKGFIAADATATSPFANNVYVVWTRFAATTDVWFSRSVNQGLTWSPPIQLSNSGVEGFVWPAPVI